MRRIEWGMGLVCGLLVGVCAAVEDVSSLRLVPFPKDVQLQAGQFQFAEGLVLEAPAAQSASLARLLNDELHLAGLPPATVTSSKSKTPAFRLAAKPGPILLPTQAPTNHLESHVLEVRPGEIVCGARQEVSGRGWWMQWK